MSIFLNKILEKKGMYFFFFAISGPISWSFHYFIFKRDFKPMLFSKVSTEAKSLLNELVIMIYTIKKERKAQEMS